MAHFVNINANEFEQHLINNGFKRTISNNEVVCEKHLEEDARIVVKVYTSIRQDANIARNVGEDAIRVIAIFDRGDKTFPLFKGQRVFRTTSTKSVIERVDERLKLAYARCIEWMEKNVSPAPIARTVPRSPEFIGKPGDAIKITAVVVSIKQYGSKFLVVMNGTVRGHMFAPGAADKSTNELGKKAVFIYWTPFDKLQADEVYDLRCVVKDHKMFNGIHQTEVSNVFGKRVVI